MHPIDVLRWLETLRHTIIGPHHADRRREQRRYLKLPIEIRTAAGVAYRGFSRDLSPSGMGAVVSAALDIGDEIWIKYDHPAAGEHTTRAVVRHAKVRQRHGYRYGFEFDVALDL